MERTPLGKHRDLSLDAVDASHYACGNISHVHLHISLVFQSPPWNSRVCPEASAWKVYSSSGRSVSPRLLVPPPVRSCNGVRMPHSCMNSASHSETPSNPVWISCKSNQKGCQTYYKVTVCVACHHIFSHMCFPRSRAKNFTAIVRRSPNAGVFSCLLCYRRYCSGGVRGTSFFSANLRVCLL